MLIIVRTGFTSQLRSVPRRERVDEVGSYTWNNVQANNRYGSRPPAADQYTLPLAVKVSKHTQQHVDDDASGFKSDLDDSPSGV